MAYKQKHTKSAFPFKASFDNAYNSIVNANKTRNSADNSEVSETQKVNGLDCPTFGGGPRKYDKNGLVIK
tara:strand:+ start:273 stop:482 length:210 start_codon:yes stop_codon:yes gene_type:complete